MSVLNFRPIEFYKPDAFSAFTPTSDLDLGTARGLMWASQLAYELDTQSSKEQVDKVKTILDRLHLELIQIGWFPLFLIAWMRTVDLPTRRRLMASVAP